MGMPGNIGIVDTMIGFPHEDMKEVYRFITRRPRTPSPRKTSTFRSSTCSRTSRKGSPRGRRPGRVTLREMDLWGVEMGLIGVGDRGHRGEGAEAHPDRFIPSTSVDPNDGMNGIRSLVPSTRRTGSAPSASSRPGPSRRSPINDKKMYPIYAKCVELGIPIFCCAGVPGPRLSSRCQHVALIDEVMFDFPDLVFVTRHGCEPWTDLAVKLMLKWPSLYYSTSAFAPKYYPTDIVDYANTRGADKSSTPATSRWDCRSSGS